MAGALHHTRPGRGRRTPGSRRGGLVSLLELYHAAERVRVDGEEKDDIGDGTREGLMLACRGLAEYVALQMGGTQ